jgi:prepilin-type N-terminal cleavage/methylation domain-containing protein
VHSRGFTLIEVLAGLVILGIIMTTSLAVFFERQRRLLLAEETVIAWQALSNEAELQRHAPYALLVTGSKGTFRSEPDLLDQLPGATALVSVRQTKPDFKYVTLTIRWRDGVRSAELTLVRGDTGGTALW